MTTEDAYRKAVFASPEALYQQIPFYAPRVIYLGLAGLITWLGIPLVVAMQLISALSISVLFLLVSAWIKRNNLILWGLLLLSFQMLGLFKMGRIVTPDALSALVIFVLVKSFIEKKENLYFILMFLPLIRTDYLIFSLLACGYKYFRASYSWIYLGYAVGAILMYFLINHICGNYGYAIVVQQTLVEASAFPKILRATWDLHEYPGFLESGLSRLAKGNLLPITFVMVICFMYRVKHISKDACPWLMILGTFCIVHFLAFPAGFHRFYAGPLLIFLAVLLKSYKDNSVVTKR